MMMVMMVEASSVMTSSDVTRPVRHSLSSRTERQRLLVTARDTEVEGTVLYYTSIGLGTRY